MLMQVLFREEEKEETKRYLMGKAARRRGTRSSSLRLPEKRKRGRIRACEPSPSLGKKKKEAALQKKRGESGLVADVGAKGSWGGEDEIEAPRHLRFSFREPRRQEKRKQNDSEKKEKFLGVLLPVGVLDHEKGRGESADRRALAEGGKQGDLKKKKDEIGRVPSSEPSRRRRCRESMDAARISR